MRAQLLELALLFRSENPVLRPQSQFDLFEFFAQWGKPIQLGVVQYEKVKSILVEQARLTEFGFIER